MTSASTTGRRDHDVLHRLSRGKRAGSSTSQPLSCSHSDAGNEPTQAVKRATGAPQGDSCRLRRGFGYASACIISPVMSTVSHSAAITYKPGHRTGGTLTDINSIEMPRSSIISRDLSDQLTQCAATGSNLSNSVAGGSLVIRGPEPRGRSV